MIIGQAKRDIDIEGIESSHKMSISTSDETNAHIIKVLTETYHYPENSIVRENFSNHWDSQVENGNGDEPITVKLYKNITGNYTLETSDNGLGLSEEEFYKYYMGIGESSKRNKPNLIGGMGLGCKAALSKVDSFEIICIKNNVKNRFLIYKGEEFPECTKLSTENTTERNGVTIKIPVDRWDFSDWKLAIKKELCYFPNALIQIEGDSFDYLNAKIFENELFRWSEVYPSNEMHISFGYTHYRINWELLKISPIDLPIAIKIPLDSGVIPEFNREQLQYSKTTKEYIKNKIIQISNYFVEKYNEQQKDEYELLEVFNKITDNNKYVTLSNQDFKINDLLQYATITPKELKIKGINVETPEYYWNKRNYIFDEYTSLVDYTERSWVIKRPSAPSYKDITENNVKLIEVNKTPSGLVKKFLLEKYNGKIKFISKVKQRKLGKKAYNLRRDWDYMYILNLVTKPKQEYRQRITEWQFAENQFKSLIINELNVENSNEYLNWLAKYKEEQKNNRKLGINRGNHKVLNKQQGQVTLAYAIEKSIGKGYKFDKTVRNINELHKQPGLTILFTEEQKELALQWRDLQNKWGIAIIGKNEAKKIEGIHNHITYKQFMEKSKVFKRLTTSFLFWDVIEQYNDIYSHNSQQIIQELLKPFSEDVQKLKDYATANGKYIRDNEICDSIKAIAKEHNLYDYELWDVYQRVVKNVEKYSFISLIKNNTHNSEDIAKIKSLINQILYHRKMYHNQFEELEITVKQPEVTKVEEETILEEQLETV